MHTDIMARFSFFALAIACAVAAAVAVSHEQFGYSETGLSDGSDYTRGRAGHVWAERVAADSSYAGAAT